MNQAQTQIKNFSESFFKSLKCNLTWNEECLVIEKIPKDFEEFYGKPGPYRLVFSENHKNQGELLNPGSFLLKTMSSYLETLGQTTLVKINFDRDYKSEFQKYLKLKNTELYNIVKKTENRIIHRFTFLTNLQYLNEKEQLMNTIYIREGKIIFFNLDKYSHSEGKKEDIPSKDIKKDYLMAKEELKNLLKKRIEETSSVLKSKLEKEKARIQEYCSKQINEIEMVVKRQQDQITNLEKQLSQPDKDEELIKLKIQKLQENISQIQNPERINKIKKEEEFFLNDEVHKHSLNINNKLMNTTIIYHPIFTFELYLKNKYTGRQISITYDPLEDSITNVNCESCKRAITEILICSSGHISCSNCYELCKGCNEGMCINCKKKSCDSCGRALCKKCMIQCTSCRKLVCKNHIRQDYFSEKDHCMSCLKKCSSCHRYTTNSHTKITNSEEILCKNCYGQKSINEILEN
ncbi:hypothetical protein COU54_01515 [Candidatus Pacearchaeota archaeon CG10_big_fil_rev_8_21_14_0_10_31_24]|nr:MAG: hypothetical protein COU54_01515 [Candidatus Pacearchaeota archaeon CG10_big_fil_rev_8_21_14_0_10_31_24]